MESPVPEKSMFRFLLLLTGLVLHLASPAVHALDAVDASYAPAIRVPGTVVKVAWHAASSKYYVAVTGDKINGQPLTTSLVRCNADGTWDSSYLPRISGGTVKHIIVQYDDKIILAGDFTSVDDHATRQVARLLSTGSVDTAFACTATTIPTIRSIATSGGLTLVGCSAEARGTFYSPAGVWTIAWPQILFMLSSSGSVVKGFYQEYSIAGAVASSGYRQTMEISTILVKRLGGIVVAGNFTKVGHSNMSGLVELASSGFVSPIFDPVFTPPPSTPFSFDGFPVISALAEDSSGKIVAAGYFTAVNGSARTGLARLDNSGNADPSFNPSVGFSYPDSFPAGVSGLGIDTSGRIVISGYFDLINGTPESHFARLDSTGTLDPSFGFDGFLSPQELTFGPDGRIVTWSTGSVWSGGEIQPSTRIFSDDGTLPQGLDLDLRKRSRPDFMVARPGTGPLAGELRLKEVGGSDTGNIGGTTLAGATDTSFRPQPEPPATMIQAVVLPDGRILVSGYFKKMGGLTRPSLALLEADGSPVAHFDLGTGPNQAVTFLKLLPSGKVLAYGGFNSINGQPANGTVLIDPAAVSNVPGLIVEEVLEARYGTSGAETEVTPRIASSLVAGKIELAVDPATIGTDPAPGEAKTLTVKYRTNRGEFTTLAKDNTSLRLPDIGWNSGIIDPVFRPQTTGYLHLTDAAAQSDGRILVLGDFTTIGGTAIKNLARLNPDGSPDPSFNPSSQFSYFSPRDLLIDAQDRIYVGTGWLQLTGSSSSIPVCRLTPDGALDTTFTAPTYISSTEDIQLDPGGGIWCTGSFSPGVAGQRRKIARLLPDGSTDPLFDAGISSNEAINAMCLEAPDKIWIRGIFTSVQGQPRDGLALIRLGTPVKPAARVVPVLQTVTDGTAAVFRLADVGSGEAYQWFRDNVPIPGATGSSLELANLMPAATQTYRADVTNVAGTTSPTGTLTVRESTLSEWLAERGIFTTHGAQDSDGDGVTNQAEYLARTNPLDGSSVFRTRMSSVQQGLRLSWPTFPGRRYVIEQSYNLVSWLPAGLPIDGDGAEKSLDLSILPGDPSTAYWRVRVIKP